MRRSPAAIEPRITGGKRHARALLARQEGHPLRHASPIPKIEDPRDAIIKVTSCAICGSDLHLYDGFMPGMESGDIMGHEFMGEVVEVGAGEQEAQGRRPRRRAVHDHLRRVRAVPARQLLGLRAHQPQQGDGRQGVRPHHGRPVRLHPPDRRLSRRPGRIRARALRRRRRRSRSRTASPTSRCCSSATSSRPAGRPRCSATSSRPTRWRSGAAGRSASSAIRSAVLLGAKQVIAIDRVPERLAMARGRRRHHDQLRRGERGRAPERADRRQGAGEVHRRGRHGGARDRARSTRSTTAPSRR